MYCENCGKQIEDGSRFCRYCGRETDAAEILTDTVGRAESAVIVDETAAAAVTGMAEAGTKDKQKKSKRGVIAAITAVIVATLAVFVGFSIYNKAENRLARALALGQRYLLEENYEQAIVEFNRAIEIDPKNEEAYVGLAEAYVETDDLEKAVRILEKGAEKTDSEKLQEILEKYTEKLAQADESDIVAESEAESPKDTGTKELELLPEDIEAAAIAQETNDMIVPAEEEPTIEAESESPTATVGEETFVSYEAGQAYSDEQLCDMARMYYIERHNYNPEYVQIDMEEGDTVTIHLYDYLDNHTATCDWYYIDRYTAEGTNFRGEEIDLTQ